MRRGRVSGNKFSRIHITEDKRTSDNHGMIANRQVIFYCGFPAYSDAVAKDR